MKDYTNHIIRYLRSSGLPAPAADHYARMSLWQSWYAGKVASFHRYRQYNGRERITRERRSLGMAKCVCEDWANLLLNEQVRITLSDPAAQSRVDEVLERSGFRWRANQLIELTFALGSGAFVTFLENGRPTVDFVRGDMIFPLKTEGGVVTECAFASVRREGDRDTVYLNLHTRDGNGCYVIGNRLLQCTEGGGLLPLPLPEGLAESWQTGSPVPLFQIIRPNIVNSLDPDSPLGISVFAGAIDQLEGVDLIYDSYCNEFRLGKKRLIVPTTFARIEMEADGVTLPVFDANDTEFFAVNLGSEKGGQLQEINMELRADAHETALKTALTALSLKCGMGAARYRFESGTVKTATEVISARSDLYQTLRKHELLLRGALVGLCRAILSLCGLSDNEIGGIDIDVSFDDSIIEDTAAQRERDLTEVREGIMSRGEYREKWYGAAAER